MKKKLVKIFAAVVLLLFIHSHGYAEPVLRSFVPSEPVLGVSELKKGMKGYLKTVISGEKITKHSISIIGVLPRKLTPRHLILVKITDKKLLEAGGAAAGMSGSPVYVNDKLIGAFAYSWTFADKSLGLVTPIEDMCNAFAWKDSIPSATKRQKTETSDFTVENNFGGNATLENDNDDNTKEERDVHPPVLIRDFEKLQEEEKHRPVLINPRSFDVNNFPNAKLVPLGFILQSDGLDEAQIKKLENELGTKIVPFAAASEAANPVRLNVKLLPGASMGTALIWGDITLGGIGTLTATDKYGRCLAFGHPMLNRGSVAIPLTTSKIVRIIPNLERPFKLGSIGQIIGLISQDRPEAIGGYFGKLPPSVSYSVLFHDLDNERTKAKRFCTVADPYLSPKLGESGVLAILRNEWAKQREGTIMLKVTFNGGGLSHPWERSDIFFSKEDVLKPLEKNLALLAEIFAQNKFEEINPLGIDFEASITKQSRVAYVEAFEIEDEKEFYDPGDKITLKVTIHPWRSERVTKRLTLRIPKKSVGMCEIDVRAGGIEPIKETAVLRGLAQITNFESLLRELSVQETNNMLIAEIGGPELPEDKKSKHESTLDKMDNKRKSEDEKEDGEKQPIDTEEKKSEEEEQKIPKFLTDTRLMSEVLKDQLAEGSICILDTNYYMDGLLRKFVKIKKPDSKIESLQEQLDKLMAAVEKEEKRAQVKAKQKGKSASPDAQYFRLNRNE